MQASTVYWHDAQLAVRKHRHQCSLIGHVCEITTQMQLLS